MTATPLQVTLELAPSSRLDVIDVTRRLAEKLGGDLGGYRKALYCSHHTTAGYLEQSLCARLDHDREGLRSFIEAFQRLFPPDAGYRHDALHLRSELTDRQRLVEPKNGDSHLTFISSGLKSCVTYANPSRTPVYFIDLDGVNGTTHRRRKTTVIAFDREEIVHDARFRVPVSGHAIDSVNLSDPRLGLFAALERELEARGIQKGRVDLHLSPGERHVGLTVNEYETLLMQHDLVDVLRNPLRFMAGRGRHMIAHPRAIPSKFMSYAKYDMVQVLNETLDALGISESILERIVDRFLAVPTSRCLRMKRSVSLPVATLGEGDRPRIVEGTYQSPILVQWRKAPKLERHVTARLVRLA